MRNELLAQLMTEDLIKIAEAINTAHPGSCKKTKDVCLSIFNDDKVVNYLGLGALLSFELAHRLKEKL